RTPPATPVENLTTMSDSITGRWRVNVLRRSTLMRDGQKFPVASPRFPCELPRGILKRRYGFGHGLIIMREGNIDFRFGLEHAALQKQAVEPPQLVHVRAQRCAIVR